MSINVPWLSREAIAQIAAEVLWGYEHKTGRTVSAPIPAEDIIERYLGLDLEFVDFYQKHGLNNVFGALYVKQRTIAISESLSFDKNEGRLVFTCAHEAGHWCLHRRYVDTASRTAEDEGVVLCRSGRSGKLPVEWQADYFACCLLMPEEMVRGAWNRAFSLERGIINICNEKKSSRTFNVPGFKFFEPCIENWHVLADIVRAAGRFSNVSKLSMIIRLQELGLVRNLTGKRMDWSRLQFAGSAMQN